MGVGKEALKAGMSLTPWGRVALEAGKFIGPEGRTRRRVVYGIGGAALGVGIGAGMLAPMNSPDEQHVMAMDAGDATVKEIDPYLAEIRVVGFQTEVDGTWIENRETDRKLMGVPLPDITHELVVNDRLVDSALCLPAGPKDMTEWTEGGVKHIEYVVNPSDIEVCSNESPDSLAISIEGGNWITDINNADKDLQQLGRDVTGERRDFEIEDDKLRGTMSQIARNLALRAVNEQCAPLVFDVTKESVLDRIEEVFARDGEVFTAKYSDDISDVQISGKSEIDAFFEKLPSQQPEGKKISYEVRGLGECELSPELAAEYGATEAPAEGKE